MSSLHRTEPAAAGPRAREVLAAAVTVVLLASFAAGCGEPEGLVSDVAPFPWRAAVSFDEERRAAAPGGTWTLDYDVTVDLGRWSARYGRFTELIVAVLAHREHDADGFYRPGAGSVALSANFTTTGVPIERHAGWPRLRLLHGRDGSPFEAVAAHRIDGRDDIAADHRIEGTLSVALPDDTPAGLYRPRLLVFVRVDGVAEPIPIENFGSHASDQEPQLLPLVRVGEPAAPRLPWTILQDVPYLGRRGVLPREEAGRVALVGRSGYPGTPVYLPDGYAIHPGFPSVFPLAAVPPLEGGLELFPEEVPTDLDFGRGEVSLSVRGPDGTTTNHGTRRMVGRGESGPTLEGGPFHVDMRRAGAWELTLTGWIEDDFGRRFEGGGTYVVETALPLTFSTSVKPGRPFEVGSRYPAKVNVNPPVPAAVAVEVDYYPRSDPERLRRWRASGTASRFGHFVPWDEPPLEFDEPGEYVSRVTATFVDARGTLWRGRQTSSGVVAPRERRVALHGTRTLPYGLDFDRAHGGAVKRYAGRPDMISPLLPRTPTLPFDPNVAFETTDTLFIPSSGYNESLVVPHLSLTVRDGALRRRLRDAHRLPAVLPPPLMQPLGGDVRFLDDVVEVSADSAAWYDADHEPLDELPVLPIGDGRRHPYAFPENNRLDAWYYLGVVRPGFPVMTGVVQSDAVGLYWLASPNTFGNHYNVGLNGDLPGDLYHVQGGVALLDRETGETWYDGYASTIAVSAADGRTTAVLAPGERPLTRVGGHDLYVLLAQDTHDTLEVGEKMMFGGLVMPAVPDADVTWTVTKPSGEVVVVPGIVARLGGVHGAFPIELEEPGLYRAEGIVRWEGHVGYVPGSYDGTFWHCVVRPDGPRLLSTTLGPRTTVDAREGTRIPLTWPADLEDVTLHWGVIMPGRILDQGAVSPAAAGYEFPFYPAQMAVQHPLLDVRNYVTGEWELADTVVFQFFLEGTRDGERVHDALRLALRRDRLYDYRLLAPALAGTDAGARTR